MSAAQVLSEQEQASANAVRLLYVCDFPPSHAAGGSILLARLLESYPADSLMVLTGSHASRVSTTEGRLACPQITFPTSRGWGRWGLGRIRVALDWLRLPLLTLLCMRLIRRHSSQVVMTLLHGRFYFAACAAARLTGTPYVLFVHDYYLDDKDSMFASLLRFGTGMVTRHAARLYAVSAGMQQKLKNEFGVDSELQLPATRAAVIAPSEVVKVRNEQFRILYAGAITTAVEDSLDMLIRIVADGGLKESGINSAMLQLFSVIKPNQLRRRNWDDPNVQVSSWIPQGEIPQTLSRADMLFLPFSFREEERGTTETAFPSKTADYLASGRPILVFGPKYSTLVRYARQEGFAEIVDEFDAAALLNGIQNIALSQSRQHELASRSLETFAKNHDIERQRREFQSSLRALSRLKTSHR
ncbi:MAG TPA: glycosyltransferase [Candidatus Sulfotelmatobacter sp.]